VNTSFAGADLRNVRMQDANLTGALFTEGADLAQALLVRSDFSGADFRSSTAGTASRLTDARVWGARFDGANLSPGGGDPVDASGIEAFCVLDPGSGETLCASFNEADFTGADLRQSLFVDAGLVGTLFTGADLRDAWLIGLTSDLTVRHPCCLIDPDTTECVPAEGETEPGLPDDCPDFTGAQMQGIAIPNTDFSLFWDTATAADFSDANLEDSHFPDLDMRALQALSGVNLRNANLAGTNLSGDATADCDDSDDPDCMRMVGADLDGAWLSSSDGGNPPTFSTTKLEYTDLSDAVLATDGLTFPCQSWTDPDDDQIVLVECVSFQGALMRGATLRSVDFIELAGFDFATTLVKDLSGADLSGSTLSSEQDPADFAGYDLTRTDLSSTDLSHASFSAATLTEANLAGATLVGAVFGEMGNEAKLWRADLDGAVLCAEDDSAPPDVQCVDFQYASFVESGGRRDPVGMRGLDFSLAADDDLLGIQSFELLDLTGTNLAGKDLSGIASFVGAVLSGADLSGTDFGSAILAGADLSGAKLVGLDEDASPLSGSDMSNVTLAGADLSDVDLCDPSRARCVTFAASQSFERVKMRRVDFAVYDQDTWSGRCFAGANLTGAALSPISGALPFAGLDLTGSSFAASGGQAADLTGVDLSDSTLHGVSFTDAELTGAVLRGADFCPDGSPLPWPDACESPPTTPLTICADFTNARLKRADLFGFAISEYPSIEQQGFFQQLATNASGRPDLEQVDLTLADLEVAGGIDLTRAELDQASLTGANLTGATLTDARMGRVTGGCITDTDGLQGIPDATVCTRLTNAQMMGVRLVAAQLADSDLSGAVLVDDSRAATLDGADLSGASLLGTVLGKDPLAPGDLALSASLIGADLQGATLCLPGDSSTCAKLGGATLRDAVLAELDFGLFGDLDFFTKLATRDVGDGQERIDLGAVDLTLAQLPGMELSVEDPGEEPPWVGAWMEGAELDGANLSGANLQYARLARSSAKCGDDDPCLDLAGALLNGADLSRSTLAKVDLSDAELGADLTGEDEEELGGTLFQKANLADSTFIEADLSRIDLAYAILDRGDYSRADFAKDAAVDENGFCTGLVDVDVELDDRSDLRGALLLGANFGTALHFNEGCIIVDQWTRYDDETIFPSNFSQQLKNQMTNIPEPRALLAQLGAIAALSLLARRRRAGERIRSSSRSASGPAH
jgi:uncharacterized protein YjbI with pentapeptide repeats